MARQHLWLPTALAAAALLAGCATAVALGPGDRSGTQVSTQPAAVAARAAVPAALDFTAPALSGGHFSGRSLAGRSAVLWFWTPGCGICQGEAPEVAAVARQYAGKVAFVGVPGLASEGDMRTFVTRTGVGGFPQVVDADGSLWAHFQVTSQPAFAFLHPDGRLQLELGPLAKEDLARRAAELIR